MCWVCGGLCCGVLWCCELLCCVLECCVLECCVLCCFGMFCSVYVVCVSMGFMKVFVRRLRMVCALFVVICAWLHLGV